MESIYSIYLRSPRAALEESIRRRTSRQWYTCRPHLFCWQTTRGIDGVTYGSFRVIYKDELDRRAYRISMADYDVSIEWLDRYYVPRTCPMRQIPNPDYY